MKEAFICKLPFWLLKPSSVCALLLKANKQKQLQCILAQCVSVGVIRMFYDFNGNNILKQNIFSHSLSNSDQLLIPK